VVQPGSKQHVLLGDTWLLQVVSVVSAPGGGAARAASIGTDGCLRLWDINSGVCISNQVGVRGGRRLAGQDRAGGTHVLWRRSY
jgi:WD40 repeat protein